VELKAMIMYNDSLQKKTKQIKVLKTKSFIIPTYGGIKVDASVGIAFGQFFDKPLSYFKEDSTNIIVSSELDDFLPIIASFIHFYPSTSGNISVGGTFGVGFPVTGNESLQSIFFFLGPTILLGKNDRVVLSAGMMGGRNKSLSKGFQLGDVVEGPGEIPTISSYELGGFVGISFNLTAKK
jgi:hypothetical protein